MQKVIPAVFICLFLLLGLAFIPTVGIEDDEALIASGMYGKSGFAQDLMIGGHRLPLMLMSHVGGLKSWLYFPVFEIWRPSRFSLRLPALLLGACTIWFCYLLLLRLAGNLPATVGCILLATHTTFFLTTCFDWGPVALQHFLLVGGLLCLVKYHDELDLKDLAIGFFCFGLGVWDKALFVWILNGVVVAALVVLSKNLRQHCTRRTLAVAAIAFCVGAAPLILYNISFPLNTFRSNAKFSTEDFPSKLTNLNSTFSGQALFGYLVRPSATTDSRVPEKPIEQFSVKISRRFGQPIAGFFGYAFILALLLTPLFGTTRTRWIVLFSVTAMVIAWLQMLFTKTAGTAAHHVILLWPFPAIVCAVVFADAAARFRGLGRLALWTAVAFIVGTNLLVTNEYFARLAVNGPGLVWTDAIDPLLVFLDRNNADVIFIDDWGIFDVLDLLSRGGLPLVSGSFPLANPHLDDDDRHVILERIRNPRAVFVSHTDEYELFKGVNGKLREVSQSLGYDRRMLATIADRNGRPIFEIVRFAPH